MRCYKTIGILEQTYCHFTFLVCHLCASLAKVTFFYQKLEPANGQSKDLVLWESISMTFLRHHAEFLPFYAVFRYLVRQYQPYAKNVWYTMHALALYPVKSNEHASGIDTTHPFYYTCWQFSDMQYLSFLFHSCPIYSMFPLAWCQWNLKRAAQCCYPSILVYRPHKSTLSIVHRPLPYFSMALFHSRGQPCKGFARTVPTARIPISSR